MRKFTILSISMLMVVMSSTFALSDTSFRCKNDIIDEGYTMHQVRTKCGAPYSEQIVGERTTYEGTIADKHKVKQVSYISEWIYNRNVGFVILTFEGSRLVKKEYVRQ